MTVPTEIVSWFRSIFADVNKRLSEKILNVPAIHETHLDTTFIEHLLGYASPRRFPSKWAVRIDAHYIGGLRHFHTWEIADIGVFVFFQRAGRLVRQKVALLQSKRLYPLTGEIEHLDKVDYMIGMARIGRRDAHAPSILAERKFNFTFASRYRALISGDEQQEAIRGHFERYGIPIYYLLYNPPRVPLSLTVPLFKYQKQTRAPKLGARVVPMKELFGILEKQSKGFSPSLGDMQKIVPGAAHRFGWRLEHFMADLILSCNAGRRFSDADEEPLHAIFYRRSGPIAAAIAVTVEMPDDAELPD